MATIANSMPLMKQLAKYLKKLSCTFHNMY